MGFQLPITISDAIRQIQRQHFVLPAIQREFVWDDAQITRLFDSILRGYPIGSFLSWKIAPDTSSDFKFYGFLKDYHEKEHPHCPVLDLPPSDYVAILDGQQRLTALNIGLRGSYAARVKGGWWNNPKSFPETRLYLNVLGGAEEGNEQGMLYDFQMKEEPVSQPEDGLEYWYPVYRLFEIEEITDLMAEVAEHNLGNNKEASRLIGDLYRAIHHEPAIYFYEEEEQDVDKVLDIFIRVNSGGEPLSYSDLLLSIATAQWSERDARESIHSLVDDLNALGQGFRFNKDLVLKSGLVLIGVSDIGFKVRNFNHANMSALQKQWDLVRESLEVAVGLFSDFGLSEATLTAGSALIPIAYYVHRRQLTQAYRTQPAAAEDRRNVRSWVLRSLVKQGVWGSGLDTLLRELRDVIDEHGASGFPLQEIESRMAARGKSLAFSPEEIEELLELRYGKKRTFAALALLFPHVDTRNIHHVDHVYPQTLLFPKNLKEAQLSNEQVNRLGQLRDQLPNLQLLEGPQNIGKSGTPPLVWAQGTFEGDDAFASYLSRNELPGLPADSHEFEDWFKRRRDALAVRFTRILDVGA